MRCMCVMWGAHTLTRPRLLRCTHFLSSAAPRDKMNGHPTFVHGGIISLVIDNTFGWLFFGLDLPLAVTANLNVNYRAPLPMNTTCILQSKLIRHEGRKMFMEATMHDLHGTKIADSTSLFISLRPAAAMAATVQMKAREYFLPEKEGA